MQFRKAILSIILASAAVALAKHFGLVGFSMAGAGHGSGLLGYLFYSPVIGSAGQYFMGGLFIWFFLGFLLPWCERRTAWTLTLILLIVGYAGTVWNVIGDINNGDSVSYLKAVAQKMPIQVLAIASIYLFMQLAVIGRLIQVALQKQPKLVSNL